MWKKAAHKSLEDPVIEHVGRVDRAKDDVTSLSKTNPLFKGEGRQVWRPKKQPRLADLVASLRSAQKQSPPITPTALKTMSLQSRQQMLQHRVLDRVHTTKAFFEDEIVRDTDNKARAMFKETSKRVLDDIRRKKKQKEGGGNLADVVSLYLEKMRAEGGTDTRSFSPHLGVPTLYTYQNSRKRESTGIQTSSEEDAKPGAISLEKWCKIVREKRASKEKGIVRETEV